MAEYQTKLHQHKIDAVDRYKEQFQESRDFIFANYRGLSVEQITALRNKLRERNAEFRVIKNRYAKLAFHQMEMPDVDEYLTGPTALALSKEEFAPVIKEIIDFAKENPVELKGSIVEGNVYDAAQTEELSKLPTRDQLIAQLMGTMQAPVQYLMHAMNGVTSKLVRTVKAVEDKKRSEEEAS